MGQQLLLHLGRGDLLTAAVDLVLGPPHHHEVTGGQTPHHVPGPVEAVRGERRAVVLLGAVVAPQRVRAPGEQFAGRAVRHRRAVVVHHQHLVVRRDGPALGGADQVLGVVEAGEVDQALRHAEDLLHGHPERGSELAGMVLRQPCPADLHDREAPEVPGAGGGLLRPVGDERRRQRGQGHTLPLDEGERRLRAGVGCDHDGSPGREGAQHPGAGEGEVEPEGQHRQVHGPRVERADLGAGARVVGVVVVRARDELRESRRPAGQQQESDVGGVRPAVVGAGDGGEGRGRPQRLEGDEAVVGSGITDHDDMPQRAVSPLLRPHLAHQSPVVEPGVPVGHDTGHGTRDTHQMADLPAPVARHGVHRNGTEPLQPEPDQQELRAVGELHDHAVAPAHPESAQSAGDTVRLGVELSVGPPPIAVDQGDALPVAGRSRAQTRAEGHSLPVAGGSVARRFGLGPGPSCVGHGAPPLIAGPSALAPTPVM